MNSLILQTATRYLLPLMLLFSLFLLMRGHQEPGGGFVGGLVAAAALTLYCVAFGVRAARRLLRADPRTLIGGGLVVALGSAALALLVARPFMTGLWLESSVAGIAVGTPVIFDIGVYLVVLGTVLTMIFTLAEQ